MSRKNVKEKKENVQKEQLSTNVLILAMSLKNLSFSFIWKLQDASAPPCAPRSKATAELRLINNKGNVSDTKTPRRSYFMFNGWLHHPFHLHNSLTSLKYK